MKEPHASMLLYDPLIALVDLLAMQSCSLGVFVLAQTELGISVLPIFLHTLPLACFATVAILSMSGLYNVENLYRGAKLILPTILAAFLFVCLWGALCYWHPAFAIPVKLIAYSVVAQCNALLAVRYVYGKMVRRKAGHRRVMVLVSNQAGISAISERVSSAIHNWSPAYEYKTEEEFFSMTDQQLLWDTVLITEGLKRKTLAVDRLMLLQKEVIIVPNTFDLAARSSQALQIGDLMMLAIVPPHLNKRQRLVRRALDIATSSAMLVTLAPIMTLTAVVVRFTSKGCIFFTQERTGLNGKVFRIYKFRTMITDAEQRSGPVLATANDLRITKAGKFLRKTRLDELPQLVNVLKGDMSLVGPRPERPHFVKELSAEFHGYETRLAVQPGITGLAQVCGGYSSTADHKLKFDLMYIHNQSLMLDLWILFKTVAVVLDWEKSEGVQTNAIRYATPDTSACLTQSASSLFSSSL
jgi:exopolysaccharide biosynthesis polyprenyl glycosylphosphotransferase